MIAWAQALAAQGELDKARWLAARCASSATPAPTSSSRRARTRAQAAQAFQCQPPTRDVHWREFR